MAKQETNKNLESLEVAMAAVKFLGLEERCEDPFVRRYDCANFVQVDLALQYCPETSYPTYELSAQLFLNPEGKIDSICVNEFQGSYYDYIREVDSLLEGYVGCYESVLKNTYFKKTMNGQLEVSCDIHEECGHTIKGVDRTDSKTIEVYEFDGDWKNLSSDMKKVGQVSQKTKK